VNQSADQPVTEQAAERRPGGLRLLLIGLKLAVSAGLLALVIQASDFAAIGALLVRVEPAAALLAVLSLAAISVVSGLRWWLVGRAIAAPLGLGDCVRLMFIGSFFTQVLPTSIGGDAVRILFAGRRGLPYGRAFSGVMLERAGGLLALVIMVAGGALWLDGRIEPPLLQLALVASLPTFLLVLALLCGLDLLPLPARLRPMARPFLALAADARKVVLAPGTSFILLLLSLAAQLCSVVAVYALARGLGLGLDFTEALAAVPAIILIVFFPISFAGWGVREGASAIMLGFVGIAPDEAVAISVLFGLALLAAGLPGMLLWLAAGRRRRG
jgi:glycosyltransferase 2 family protein